MKLLPWTLLSIILVSSIVFGQSSPSMTVHKTLGVPAADEWLDLESGIDSGPGVQFSVPPGRVLTMVYEGASPENNGTTNGTLDIDGVVVIDITVGAGKLAALYSGTPGDPWVHGLTASAGQVVTVTRTGGGAPASEIFFVRGWLEPIP
jgi:hypothetical protein